MNDHLPSGRTLQDVSIGLSAQGTRREFDSMGTGRGASKPILGSTNPAFPAAPSPLATTVCPRAVYHALWHRQGKRRHW